MPHARRHRCPIGTTAPGNPAWRSGRRRQTGCRTGRGSTALPRSPPSRRNRQHPAGYGTAQPRDRIVREPAQRMHQQARQPGEHAPRCTPSLCLGGRPAPPPPRPRLPAPGPRRGDMGSPARPAAPARSRSAAFRAVRTTCLPRSRRADPPPVSRDPRPARSRSRWPARLAHRLHGPGRWQDRGAHLPDRHPVAPDQQRKCAGPDRHRRSMGNRCLAAPPAPRVLEQDALFEVE